MKNITKVPTRRAEISLMNDSEGRQKQWLMFRVTFPQRYPLPKLVDIWFSDRLLCTGPEGKIQFTFVFLLHIYRYHF